MYCDTIMSNKSQGHRTKPKEPAAEIISSIFVLIGDCEQVTLGITVLLSYSMFMLLVGENMPPTSEFIPLIGQSAKQRFVVRAHVVGRGGGPDSRGRMTRLSPTRG